MSKTEKELLELAAKAAGIKGEWCAFFGIMGHGAGQKQFGIGDPAVFTWGADRLWNPLEDDGDALRLAVEISKRKDGIAILLNSRFDSTAFASVYTDANHLCGHEYMVDDPNAATRRAIVRAAAEIGKAMP